MRSVPANCGVVLQTTRSRSSPHLRPVGILDILITYRQAFLTGLGVTLKLCGVVWSAGLILGGALGIAASRYPVWIGIPMRIGSFVLSGLPIIVLLFWLHYPLQAMWGVVIDPFITACVALGAVNLLAVADVVRNSISSVPRQYLEAAKVCGIPPTTTLWKIEIPLVTRSALPPLLLSQVTMLHLTLFASLISVDELFRACQRINAVIYKPVEIYTALGVFFLLVCLPLNGVAMWLKFRYTRDLSER